MMASNLPPIDAAVHDAIQNDDAAALREALADGGSPNSRDNFGATPLLFVCEIIDRDRPDLVSILLAAGADVNATRHSQHPHDSWYKPSALAEAVNKGKLACIRVLVAGGASLTQEYGGLTPVEWMSACANCRRVLPLMLRLGSPLPRLEARGTTMPRRQWMRYNDTPFCDAETYQILLAYHNKVAAAGSWAAYERAHRARLTAIFVTKLPRLPADAISHIAGLWAHTGYY